MVLVWILFVGVGATLTMDLWALIQRRMFNMASLDYALVGRWLGHMPKGRFVHDRIAASPPVRGERPLGWIAHYAIGIAFASLLLLIAGEEWARRPTPWPAIAVGLSTVALPLVVMQPAFGLGFAASRLPQPNLARLRSIVTHLIFGTGLYVSALMLTRIAP